MKLVLRHLTAKQACLVSDRRTKCLLFPVHFSLQRWPSTNLWRTLPVERFIPRLFSLRACFFWKHKLYRFVLGTRSRTISWQSWHYYWSHPPSPKDHLPDNFMLPLSRHFILRASKQASKQAPARMKELWCQLGLPIFVWTFQSCLTCF